MTPKINAEDAIKFMYESRVTRFSDFVTKFYYI